MATGYDPSVATTYGGYAGVQPGDVLSQSPYGSVVDVQGSAPNPYENGPTSQTQAPPPPPPATNQPIDPKTGYPYGSTGDTQTLASQNQQNASDANVSIESTLNQLNLGGMANWANNLAATLAGQGIPSSTIVNTILSQLNAPVDVNGKTDQSALDAFNAAMPGYNDLIAKTGQNGSPGSSPQQAIANYIQYGAQIQAFARTSGLLPGTITSQMIGDFWSGQNSTDEVSHRITMATQDADKTMPQQVKDYMSETFGLSGAGLTSFYLNPTNTMNQVTAVQNSGITGGMAAATGFDKNLSLATSQAISAFLSGLPQPGAGSGGQASGASVNPITVSQAENFFGGSVGTGDQGALPTVTQAADYSRTAGAQVSQGDVLAAAGVVGTSGQTQAQAEEEVTRTQQARTASSKGGGGAVTTTQGAVGLGFANE